MSSLVGWTGVNNFRSLHHLKIGNVRRVQQFHQILLFQNIKFLLFSWDVPACLVDIKACDLCISVLFQRANRSYKIQDSVQIINTGCNPLVAPFCRDPWKEASRFFSFSGFVDIRTERIKVIPSQYIWNAWTCPYTIRSFQVKRSQIIRTCRCER